MCKYDPCFLVWNHIPRYTVISFAPRLWCWAQTILELPSSFVVQSRYLIFLLISLGSVCICSVPTKIWQPEVLMFTGRLQPILSHADHRGVCFISSISKDADMAHHFNVDAFRKLCSWGDAEVASDVCRWLSLILAQTPRQLQCTLTPWPS